MYEIFQRLLDEKGITAYKVAKETGISTATLSSWKKGRYTPKKEKLQKIADMIDDAQVALDALRTLVDQGGKMTNARERAFFFKDQIKPAMMRLRRPCDALEQIVDKSCWPFPTYEDMLFEL